MHVELGWGDLKVELNWILTSYLLKNSKQIFIAVVKLWSIVANFRRKKISTLKYQLLEYYPFSASILLAVDCEKGKKIDLQGYKTTSFLKAELEGEYRLGYRMMKQLQDTGYSFQKTWDTCSISDVVTNLIFPLEARDIFLGGGVKGEEIKGAFMVWWDPLKQKWVWHLCISLSVLGW